MDRSVTDDPPFKLWYNHCFLKQHSTSLISLTRTVLGTTKLELTWKNVLVIKGIQFQRQRPRTTPRRCRKKTPKKGLPCACRCADECTVMDCHVNDMRQYRPQAPGPTLSGPLARFFLFFFNFFFRVFAQTSNNLPFPASTA